MDNSLRLANAASDPFYDEPPYIKAFEGHTGIRALFFSAKGGVSEHAYRTPGGHMGLNCAFGGDDDAASKAHNRQTVADYFDVAARNLLTSIYGKRQKTGGFIIRNVRRPWSATNRPKADALITSRPGLLLGVLTADCAPVLLATPDATIVAAVHASRDGVLNGILERTIEAMIEKGARREEISAAIGPCAGVYDTYTINRSHADMCAAMDTRIADHLIEKDGQIFLRLQAYVRHCLRDTGIGVISAVPSDTIENHNYYSKRRGSAPSSLMFSGIMIKNLS
jgi:YfiH family protein